MWDIHSETSKNINKLIPHPDFGPISIGNASYIFNQITPGTYVIILDPSKRDSQFIRGKNDLISSF